MGTKVSHLAKGDLDAACGFYSVLNALRVCLRGTPQRGGFYHDLVRHLVHKVDPDIATYVVRGFNISDMTRILASTAMFVERRLGLALMFQRPFLQRGDLSQVEYFQEIDSYICRRQHAGILAFGAPFHRIHWTVPLRITARTIQIADSCNDKVVRSRDLRVAKSGTRCGPSHWMPKATFILALTPTRAPKKERRT